LINNNPFYWATIRNTIVAFGSLFSNIRTPKRDPEGTIIKDIRVPISYAGKEKYIKRFESDKNQLQNNFNQVDLPRMSFEMLNMVYDSDRKLSRNLQYVTDPYGVTYEMTPSPWNVNLKLHVYTKTQEDMLQIIEQILPYFTPNYTITLNVVPELGIKQDVPFILNSVSPDSELSDDYKEYRYLINSLDFTAKIHLFGPKGTTGVIKTVDIDLDTFGKYVVQVTPSTAGKSDVYTLTETLTEN